MDQVMKLFYRKLRLSASIFLPTTVTSRPFHWRTFHGSRSMEIIDAMKVLWIISWPGFFFFLANNQPINVHNLMRYWATEFMELWRHTTLQIMNFSMPWQSRIFQVSKGHYPITTISNKHHIFLLLFFFT